MLGPSAAGHLPEGLALRDAGASGRSARAPDTARTRPAQAGGPWNVTGTNGAQLGRVTQNRCRLASCHPCHFLRSTCVHSPPFPPPLTPAPVTHGGEAPGPRARQVQPAGKAARRPNSRFSEYVTHAALCISVQSEAGSGPGLGGEAELRSSRAPLPAPPPHHPTSARTLPCQRPAESRAPECVRLGGEGRVGTRSGCGRSHVLGGSGEGFCSPRLRASPLGAVAPTVPRLQLGAQAPPGPAKEKKNKKAEGGAVRSLGAAPPPSSFLPAPCAAHTGA